MTVLHRLSIIVDEHGHPAGATISYRYDEARAVHEPIPVGPFDTLNEVMDRIVGRLDVQLMLW